MTAMEAAITESFNQAAVAAGFTTEIFAVCNDTEAMHLHVIRHNDRAVCQYTIEGDRLRLHRSFDFTPHSFIVELTDPECVEQFMRLIHDAHAEQPHSGQSLNESTAFYRTYRDK